MQVLYFHFVAAFKLVLPLQKSYVLNVAILQLQSYEYRMANTVCLQIKPEFQQILIRCFLHISLLKQYYKDEVY